MGPGCKHLLTYSDTNAEQHVVARTRTYPPQVITCDTIMRAAEPAATGGHKDVLAAEQPAATRSANEPQHMLASPGMTVPS
ncbi:hypothetical protein TRAPUB_8552 [Trametes pubescens]|uniref:Uncharacterized protein n=1 Tax=Trametes pubescens TaxID=154538 RepID=A0A1M2W564_TRAPU|nr:hypothetical protein TRAPUB_8552 [Trametes pubescens]